MISVSVIQPYEGDFVLTTSLGSNFNTNFITSTTKNHYQIICYKKKL